MQYCKRKITIYQYMTSLFVSLFVFRHLNGLSRDIHVDFKLLKAMRCCFITILTVHSQTFNSQHFLQLSPLSLALILNLSKVKP